MRRPWQIWMLFGACLAMVLPAMLWLTLRALELDLAEARAHQQADLEEAVGSALWELDAELTRLVAPEIARPASVYQPFYRPSGGKGASQLPSPLLLQPSPYVLVHFEVHPDNTWTSPQCPTEPLMLQALPHQVSLERIRQSQERLRQLAAETGYAELLAKLPRETLAAELTAEATQIASNVAMLNNPRPPKIYQTPLNAPPVQQQIAVAQGEGMEGPDSGSPQPAIANVRQNRVQSRRGNELQSRDANVQTAAEQSLRDQYWNLKLPAGVPTAAEGISQPMWLQSRLVLARQVQVGGQTLVQGCWLDWPKIKAELLARTATWLPQADLEPVADLNRARFSRLLATLPVQLVVPEPTVVLNPYSPIRISLVIAWTFLSLAAVAVALLLQGVVALSERRAAFVSAVTHELRTPLTTFRLYAEMLAENMVPDAAQRQHYLKTLQVEADRLSHLLENVLQYARLERRAGEKRREDISVDALLERVGPRLADRVQRAQMQLEIEADAPARAVQLSTDPAAVEQILMNLVDNACKYAANAATPTIQLQARVAGTKLELRVQDHGPGIAPREAQRLFRPFSKSAEQAANSAPGVGLGLALCRRLAGDLGGGLELDRPGNHGACFVLTLPR